MHWADEDRKGRYLDIEVYAECKRVNDAATHSVAFCSWKISVWVLIVLIFICMWTDYMQRQWCIDVQCVMPMDGVNEWGISQVKY